MTDKKRRTLWISSDLWARIQKAAKEDGRTASEWLRRVVLMYLEIPH